jgi:hypothetical protein
MERIFSLGMAGMWVRSPLPAAGVDPKCRGKAPFHKGWAQVDFNRARGAYLSQWPTGEERGYNPAIRTGFVEGAPTCVVGIDCDGPEALAWARDQGIRSPAETVSGRAGGGHHILVRLEKGQRVKKSQKLKDLGIQIDIQGDSSILVAPGAVHLSGNVYRQAEPWPLDIDDFHARVPLFNPNWFPPAVRDSLMPLAGRSQVP